MSIEQATLDNSAAYLKGWLSRLHDDPKMIVFAGVAAEKAIDYIPGEEGAFIFVLTSHDGSITNRT